MKLISTKKNEVGQKTAMLQVMCPQREVCPYYGGSEPIGRKKRCYARLLDLSATNGVVWLHYWCKRTKQAMLMKQLGDAIVYYDSDTIREQGPGIPKDFKRISCSVCGQPILDIYHEWGDFSFNFKCPTHKKVVNWNIASQTHLECDDETKSA